MNELIFFIQIVIIGGFALGALKLGKQALTAWIVLQALLANLFVLKQITLFGLEVTASDAFAIGSLLGLNFLQEFFGQEEAKRTTWICFFCLIFFVLISQLHLFYTPNSADTSHASFVTLLTPAPRLLLASLGTFLIVQQIDIRLFSFLKNVYPAIPFMIRTASVLIFSQFLDTALFSFVGLYGIVTSLIDIILMSFLIKLIVIFSYTFCIRWAQK